MTPSRCFPACSTAQRKWVVIGSAPRFARLKTRQTEIEFFDFDDFERLVDGARKVDPAVLAFVLLAGEAGLRRGEIIALDDDALHAPVAGVAQPGDPVARSSAVRRGATAGNEG
jgi:integrase